MLKLSLIVGVVAAVVAAGCAGPRFTTETYRDADLVEAGPTGSDIGGAAETQNRRAWGKPMGRIDVDRYTLVLGHAAPESTFTTVRLEGTPRATTILPIAVADVTFTDDRDADAPTWQYDGPHRALHFYRPARELDAFLRALGSADEIAVLMRVLDGGALWAEVRTRTHKSGVPVSGADVASAVSAQDSP